jgi:hypothetical protein
MRRSILLFALLVLSLPTFVFAQRMRAAGPHPVMGGAGDMFGNMPMSGNTVTGVVSSVDGNLISIASGLVVIDATGAKITAPDAGPIAVSAITPGSTIFVLLKPGDVAANAPLPAAFIGVATIADVTISGAVQSVDVAAQTFTVLGRTIHVDAQTRFGSKHGGAFGLADLQKDEIVLVEANVSGASLVATTVHEMSFMPLPATRLHGTVKSIGTDSWVITDSSNNVTITLRPDTKIVGSPAVGTVVDVLAIVDSTNRYVAVSIIASGFVPGPPPVGAMYTGTVKNISNASWTIRDDATRADVTFTVNAQTKIEPGIGVNDRVVVMAVRDNDKLTAIAIVRARMM